MPLLNKRFPVSVIESAKYWHIISWPLVTICCLVFLRSYLLACQLSDIWLWTFRPFDLWSSHIHPEIVYQTSCFFPTQNLSIFVYTLGFFFSSCQYKFVHYWSIDIGLFISIKLSIFVYSYLSISYLSMLKFIYVSISVCSHLSIHLSVYLSICLPTYLSLSYLSMIILIYPSISVCSYLSIFFSLKVT